MAVPILIYGSAMEIKNKTRGSDSRMKFLLSFADYSF
jgi:hypothetical protein